MLGVVRAKGIVVTDSPQGFRKLVDELVHDLLKKSEMISQDVQKEIRNMMRIDGFSPTGRNRPASEFLLRELAEYRHFKFINVVVDINNYLSIKTKLPMSIFDTGKLQGALVVRTGDPGEGYVFNNEGQILDVKRLIVCCEELPDYTSIPFGSPVKDSMHTKIFTGCTDLVAVIYSNPAVYSQAELETICGEFASLLKEFAGASETAIEIR